MGFVATVFDTSAIVWLIVFFVLYAICDAFYSLYFHPLSSVPGPPLWILTRARWMVSLFSGYLHLDILDLHARYGPVIRIAPDEVSFADPAAWPQIYSNVSSTGAPAMPKSELWHGAGKGKPTSILSAIDKGEHARFRKAMEPGFTEKALRGQEDVLRKHMDLFIKRLDTLVHANSTASVTSNSERAKHNRGGEIVIDISRYIAYLTFDIIGELGFGESFDCLRTDHLHPWVAVIFDSIRAITYAVSLGFYPRLKWVISLAIPKSVIKKGEQHREWAADKINKRLDEEDKKILQRDDLIALFKRDEEGIHGLTRRELQDAAPVIIMSGSETVVTVLSGTLNYLMKSPMKWALLVEEVRTAFSSEEAIDIKGLKELKYLNAVLKEGLRLCIPMPVGAPRITPPEGANICGIRLPPNIYVNIPPLVLALSPDMFHDPATFHPERWLGEENSVFSNDVKSSSNPFGIGTRACIGQPLAWAELRLTLARLIWRFDLSPADSISGRLEWNSQRSFSLIERLPFEVGLKLRDGLVPLD